MKIPKEYILIIIAGFLLLSYLMDAIVDPLPTTFPTPYHYMNAATMSKYAFATTAIIIRAASFLMTPLWFGSFFKMHPGAKGGLYLVIGSLMQLYAVQEMATMAQVIPSEWAISLAMAGAALLIPAFFNLVKGVMMPHVTTSADHIQ